MARKVRALRTALASPSLLKYTNTSLPARSHSPARSAHQLRSASGVGTRVQVVLIGAVQPHVGKVCGGAQQARQVRAAHHAIRSSVVLQQREDLLARPAVMPEFHRDPDPPRNLPEEIGKPGVIAGVRGASWTSSTARLPPSSCQPAAMRASQASGAYSLRPRVRPRGALTDSQKPSGSRCRQPQNAAGRGHR